MSNELFMHFGVFEQNIAQQHGHSGQKVELASDYRVGVERMGGEAIWTSGDAQVAFDAARLHESCMVDNAQHQQTLANRGTQALGCGQETAAFSHNMVNGLLTT
ncbi:MULTISPECIES: hypothetical protein [unclassified Kribbella]|uniref:hypothetical protein n=1 Tax=unclassified Kribbella TaxID=2644121 RepID=UPI003017512D